MKGPKDLDTKQKRECQALLELEPKDKWEDYKWNSLSKSSSTMKGQMHYPMICSKEWLGLRAPSCMILGRAKEGSSTQHPRLMGRISWSKPDYSTEPSE